MQVKLTKRTVDLAKPGTQDEFHWDVDMPGFGLKVTLINRFHHPYGSWRFPLCDCW